jgi:hypothetical protein
MAFAALGVVAIFVIVLVLAGFVIRSGGSVDPNPRGYRVRQIVGLAIAAAGLSITFLPVSTDQNYVNVTGHVHYLHLDCGSAFEAMFDSTTSGCGSAAFPHVWIAGGVAAIGMAIAFWGAKRWSGLLAAVCIPLVIAAGIGLIGFIVSNDVFDFGGA